MLFKFNVGQVQCFNISEYALTNVTFSYKFAFKKMPYGRLSLRHLILLN